MLCITLEFPLGVYYAQSAQAPDRPEWPPSPVRLAGALLAAAHGRHRGDLVAERELVQHLCEANPPDIVAPRSVALGARTQAGAAALRGPSRWAPRNYFHSSKGREQAAVEKVGVAIGDRPIQFVWPTVELDDGELDRLTSLASDLTFLGTSRSPVIARISATPPSGNEPTWVPLRTEGAIGASVGVRVPDSSTVSAFDARHQLFRSSTSDVQRAVMVPSPPIGYQASYAFSEDLDALSLVANPDWWGDMIVVPIDRDRSEIVPKTAGAYLLARATRVALLSAFEDRGEAGDAPPILRSRGDAPHLAIVPLADVWHEHSDGHVMGIALMLPSLARVPDLPEQRARLERGLARLLRDTPDGPQRFVQIPGAGRIWLRPPDPVSAGSKTLSRTSYFGPSAAWVTVSPLVHSRWQKARDGGLLAQVTRDCSHVGLPEPALVEVLRGAGRPGGAARPIMGKRVPERWRGLLTGPINHLRITFPTPVRGPILLGKARHFGLGLCVADDRNRPVRGGKPNE